MSNREFKAQFQSTLGSLLEQFVKEKQACGYPYHGTARLLAQFDRFLCDEALSQCELPRSINRKWLAKRPHESTGTQWQRICAVRQFAKYMCRLGYSADVPERSLAAKCGASFSPRIPTQAEVSPHTLRHTKGMNLLQSGVPLEIIRDFLGHVDVKTTEIYARANLEMKRKALEKVADDSSLPKIPSWKQNKTLLEWLQSL